MFFQQLKKLQWEVGNWGVDGEKEREKLQVFTVLCNLNPGKLKSLSEFISILFVLIFFLLLLPHSSAVHVQPRERVFAVNHTLGDIQWEMLSDVCGTLSDRQRESSWIISRKSFPSSPLSLLLCVTHSSVVANLSEIFMSLMSSQFSVFFEFEFDFFPPLLLPGFSHSHSTFEVFLWTFPRLYSILSIIWMEFYVRRAAEATSKTEDG